MLPSTVCFFFFNDTATTEIYTLSLHDALPILSSRLSPALSPKDRLTARSALRGDRQARRPRTMNCLASQARRLGCQRLRSEEHTSELQSRLHLVCRLLLEKKKSGAPSSFIVIF